MAESQPANRRYVKRKSMKTQGLLKILTLGGLRKVKELDIYKQNDDMGSESVHRETAQTPTKQFFEDKTPPPEESTSRGLSIDLMPKSTSKLYAARKKNKILPFNPAPSQKSDKSESNVLLNVLHSETRTLQLNPSITIDSKNNSPKGSPHGTFDDVNLFSKSIDEGNFASAKTFANNKRLALLNRNSNTLRETHSARAARESEPETRAKSSQGSKPQVLLKDMLRARRKHKIERIEENKEELELTRRELDHVEEEERQKASQPHSERGRGEGEDEDNNGLHKLFMAVAGDNLE